MEFLAEKLPSFWKTFEPSLAGVEVSGYYDWLEEDGRITQKYMAMTPIGAIARWPDTYGRRHDLHGRVPCTRSFYPGARRVHSPANTARTFPVRAC